jgi:undecaprenyl diphosphate synthase
MTALQTKPQHIAIIMDGNGRWARKRMLPRLMGHKAGVDAVHEVIKGCVIHKIPVLTLFAFSSENWRRPPEEVSHLMRLFVTALEREAKKLHEQNIQLRIIGDRTKFSEKLQLRMGEAEKLTHLNSGLKLVIAANYGGKWDILQAVQALAAEVEQNKLTSAEISFDTIRAKLTLADLPEPDFFIRTSGEQRISNFFLWQLAYAELYFTDTLWPDFSEAEFNQALDFFAKRERRFGHTGDQILPKNAT